MEAHATYDDVNLILRLYELRREAKMRAAREWFANHFKVSSLDEVSTLCPLGSEENAYLRMVMSYWEMVASFITSGVLNQELFFHSGGEILFVWERCKPVLAESRERYKNPTIYKNLETVALSYIQWMNRNAPEAYAAYAERVRGS